ncbi:MAG: hypothetical protein Q8K75_08180 [Chlamydiales bacterium]|nr:hypothetical protein [Chlamydiales bacterium]
MVTSVKGHPVNLDTLNASECFHEIQKLQNAGGIANGIRASAKAIELPWHSLRDAYAHGCELFTGIPQAYRDGQLKKHSWHFVRAVSSATYATVALPLAFTPGLSLKVADSLQLREPWENQVSKGVVTRVKDTVVAMSKGPKAKSVIKITVGLAAFGALAWLAGNFNTPVAVPNVVTPPPVPPNMFGGYSMPNLGDLNFNPLLEVTSQAGKLDSKEALGTIGAVALGALALFGLSWCCCGTSKKPPKPKVEEVVPLQVNDVVGNGGEVQQQEEPEPTERTISIGGKSYPILNDHTVKAEFDETFDVTPPSEKFLSITVNGMPIPLINAQQGPWKEGDGDAWFAESFTNEGAPNWKLLSGTGPDDFFVATLSMAGKLPVYFPLEKTVNLESHEYQVVATPAGKRYAYDENWGAAYELTYAKDVHWIKTGNDQYPVVKDDNGQWYAQGSDGQQFKVNLDDQNHFRLLFLRH